MLTNLTNRQSALGGALVVVILALIGWLIFQPFGGSGPKLVPTKYGGIVGLHSVHQGDTVTIGSMVTCLDESGSVTVDDVTAVAPVGAEVTGWAIRPNPVWKPSPTTDSALVDGPWSRKTLTALQFPTSHVVDVTCDEKTGRAVEFAVEMKKTTSAEAGVHAFRVTYTSDGNTMTYTFPLAARLCNEDNADAPACRTVL